MTPRPARWLVPEHDPEEVQRLARDAGLHLPAARVLWHRGHRSVDAVQRFLVPALDDLHDPFLMQDMDRAVARLVCAVERREPVLLYGDYDVDGTSAVVVLRKAIELAGGVVRHFVPHRLRDGYGLRPEPLTEAAAEGVRLVVSVDTGIRAGDVVRHATGLGLDVIITDHHLPDAELPPALAVLNPNRPDCPYPEKALCGAGVAFKLVQGLLLRLGWPAERRKRFVESFLKLVALATVADVVPLTGENRVIVRRGLDGFRHVRNAGLRALLAVAGFQEGDKVTAGQVAFRLGPRINAAGRMADAQDVIELFLTDNPARATELAGKLNELNQERQAAEASIVRQVLAVCEQVPVDDRQAALVFCGAGWHRGVVGIVASRLVERYHRPVFVLGEEDGVAQGSGRSVSAFHLLAALETMPDLFTKFGGHRQAAGVTLPADCVDEFRQRLATCAASQLNPDDFCATYESDAAVRLSELTNEAVEEVLALAPFGCGNPAPLFMVRKVTIASDPMVFGERHLRLRLSQGSRSVGAKAWSFLPRRDELLAGTEVDFLCAVEDDSYAAARGQAPWMLTVKDVRPSTSWSEGARTEERL